LTRRTLSPLRALAFALLTPALVLGGSEAALRWLGGPDGGLAGDVSTPVNFQQVPRPLFEVTADGYAVFPELVIDAGGLSVPVEKAPDELRVLLLGGSATAGWNLPWTQNIAGIAQRELDAALPDRQVRVYNLGRSGWATAQVLELFDGVVDPLKPDVVVLVAGNNETLDIANAIALTGGETRRVLRARELRQRFALARLVPMPRELVPPETKPLDVMPSPVLRQLREPDLIARYAAARLERNVARIARRAEAAGAAFLLGTISVNDRFERWIHPLGMLPQEASQHPVVDSYLLARHYGPEEAGIEALRAVDDPRLGFSLALMQGELLDRLGRRDEVLDAVVSWHQNRALAEGAPPGDRLVRAWSARLVTPDAAADEARRDLADHPLEPSKEGDCYAAQILELAGAWDDAKAAYLACRLDAWFYRAGPDTNDALRRGAQQVGAPVVDIDAAVRSLAEHGITGERQFWDYCHYTPEGSVIAGHVVAAGILAAIGRSEAVPSPAEASAAFAARWRGRHTDPPELEHWVGVDRQPAGTLRMLDDRGKPATGDGALDALYRGNRLAASVSPGRADLAAAARQEWSAAVAADPTLADVVEGNEAWLRWLLGEGARPPERTELWSPALSSP
jgi:hypothetical protein